MFQLGGVFEPISSRRCGIYGYAFIWLALPISLTSLHHFTQCKALRSVVPVRGGIYGYAFILIRLLRLGALALLYVRPYRLLLLMTLLGGQHIVVFCLQLVHTYIVLHISMNLGF